MAEKQGVLQALCQFSRVLPTDRWECGWGVWRNRSTVFAACYCNLHQDFPSFNQKMQSRFKYSLKLNSIP
jgi:hypothetical protein